MSELLKMLQGMVNDQLQAECYGGVSILSVLPMVDIDLGFDLDANGRKTTLLVVEAACPGYEHDVPEIAKVEMNGERYLLPKPAQHDFAWLADGDVKIMRARFLLLRDYYYPRLHGMRDSMRQAVVSRFFPGGVWTPREGSDLAKVLGFTP